MSLKTVVKLSSVNNLSDARYGAGMGVSLMGFNLSSTQPGHISADTYKEISDWISGVQLVAEFTSEEATEITHILKGYKVDIIQTESVQVTKDLHAQSVPVILKVTTSQEEELRSLLQDCAHQVVYFLLEQDEPAHPIDAALLKELCAAYPVILGNHIDESNIHSILEELQPAGIALKGGDEIRPGLKDFDEISQILELLETEE